MIGMDGLTVLHADLSHNCAMEVQVDELYDILWLVLLLRVVLGGGVVGQTGLVNVVLGCGLLDGGAAVRNLSDLLSVIWS